MSVSCEKVAICTFLFSVQRSPPSHSSARFLWFQIEGPVSSVRKVVRQILCIGRLLVVCCPLQGGRFPVQFAMAPFVCETKSENVTHEECAHLSYNSLSHDCDMQSESWRAGKSTHRTSQDEPRPDLRDVSRVRISTDVAASLVPVVAAAAILSSPLVHSSCNSLLRHSDMRSVVFREAQQSPPMLENTRFLRFLMPSPLGGQVATCTFLHELLEARGGAGSSIGARSCPRARTRDCGRVPGRTVSV